MKQGKELENFFERLNQDQAKARSELDRLNVKKFAAESLMKLMQIEPSDQEYTSIAKKLKEMCDDHIRMIVGQGWDDGTKQYLYEHCMNKFYGHEVFEHINKVM